MEASWLPYVSRSSDPLVRAQPRGIFFLLSIISSSASTRNQVSSDFPLRRPVPKVAQSPTTTESCVYQTSNTSDFTRHIRASIIMNGGGDGYGQPATWQEHRTPDGRNYYYNPATKVTQWTKPEEMMSPAEVRVALSYRVGRANACRSVLSRTNHGRNTQPRVVGSIGTIPRRSRAPGRCLKCTRTHWEPPATPTTRRKYCALSSQGFRG